MSFQQPDMIIYDSPEHSFMNVDDSEKDLYYRSLRSVYGPEIITDRSFLSSGSQRYYEDKRHALNSSFQLRQTELDLYPKRLLFLITQKCTSQCSHCWVFGSPKAKCTLSVDQLAGIGRNLSGLPGRDTADWTVSGGEFFIHPDYAKVLSSFPVQCVYTNGFWGYPADRCAQYLDIIKGAVMKNALIDRSRLTFIISYDQYHIEGSKNSFPLEKAVSNIVGTAYDVFPQTAFRISQTSADSGAPMIDPVIRELQDSGYSVIQTARDDRNADIRTVSYTYRKGVGPSKELFVDLFPMTPVCRGAIQEKSAPHVSNNFNADERPLVRHQYTIGPDGGVGLYEVLYAPPVPYYAGNLIYEPWENIKNKLQRDPIAVMIKAFGMSSILEFMDTYYKGTIELIIRNGQTVQQLLYLILLDPCRKLFLNLFLLMRLYDLGRFECQEDDLPCRIKDFLSALKTAPSKGEIMPFYLSDME